MKFLSNTYDTHKPDARMCFVTSFEGWLDNKVGDYEWEQHLKWIRTNVVGEPQATDTCTVEELKQMGMVGIYSKESNE